MLAVAEAYKIARAAVGGGHDWEVARGGRAVYTASGHSHTWNPGIPASTNAERPLAVLPGRRRSASLSAWRRVQRWGEQLIQALGQVGVECVVGGGIGF
ncbi:MAG TPA: hypothetical protein VE196_08145 [Pseudonocardiaceae bacterium]|jgi:hypothetical protein|nr:hypothetical protein [Pseudonocardiaceae bacterium]